MSQCNICKKSGQLAKNVQITDTKRSQEQRTILTKTTNTNKKCEKSKRNGHTSDRSTTGRRRRNGKIDPEATMYITELMEDWNTINLIERDFENIKKTEINKMTPPGEIIIQTTLKYKKIIKWLADTGSTRSFIDIQTAEVLIQK